jgi:hypothetical protein
LYSIKAIITIFLSLIALFFISSCAEMDSHSSFSRFQKSEDTYRASMRWGEWNNVAQLMRKKPIDKSNINTALPLEVIAPSITEEQIEYLEKIKVPHVEVRNSGITIKDEAGITLLLIEYQLENSVKVNKIRHQVDWWYDKKSNIWFTETPLPKEFNKPEPKTIKLSPSNY